jgi:two-component system, NtrC family, response regulator AtoC
MRVIAASNVPLGTLVAQGKMRNDFYYRIHVIPIRLLPLRQRAQDIPLLVQDFLHHHPVAVQKRITGISRAAIDHLMEHTWPGNVRELQNILEKAVILTKSRILDRADLDLEKISLAGEPEARNKKFPSELSMNQWIQEQEKAYLIHKLKLFRGRIDLTAKSCGVDSRTIYRKMMIYGLDRKVFSGAGSKGGSVDRFRAVDKPQADRH